MHHTKCQKYISQALEGCISFKYELTKREEIYGIGNNNPPMGKKENPNQVGQVRRPWASLFQEDRINRLPNVSIVLIFNGQQL